jgi:hypothetical protein
MGNNHILAPLALALGFSNALAFDYKMLVAPIAQSSDSSCQSYALALGLAMLEPDDRRSYYEWRVDEKHDLRLHETTVRNKIERQMMLDLGRPITRHDDSTRPEWNTVIRALTFGQYKLGQKEFVSFEDAIDFLKSRVKFHSKTRPSEWFPITTPMTMYFTSFSRIGKPYKQGHIVSILGVDDSNKSFGRPPWLFLVNSAAKVDDNECVADRDERQKYMGKAGWTDDYEIKQFKNERTGATNYIINWIERN